ncbi:SusD/RagB family nutrient-binding outer membrane lipoprotein [Marinilabiliaceae bacterium ANBcel2]|nr:SusD/RagB family nutrient-binding outer membrane lipoprotein [Marinilabiliaceae bacterium ANBcel2]
MMKLKYILLVLIIGVCFAGCDDDSFLGDNRDPDGIDEVPPSQIMPVVLFYSALQNYDHAEYGAYLSQTLTTAGRSQATALAYKSGWEFLGMNRHPQWRRHFFDIGANVNEVITLAGEEDSYNYVALARLIRLMSVQYTTDVFGDMPLSEAYLSGSPAYDTQESIYEWLEEEADEVIALLKSDRARSEDNRLLDQRIDRVFGGDLEKWTQVAYAVKARILLRQIPNMTQNPSVADQILDYAMTALDGWEDPGYKFDGGSSIEKNNMWGRNNAPINAWESRANNLNGAIPTRFFVEDLMGFDSDTEEADDPRLHYIMKPRGNAAAGVDTTYRYLDSNSGMPATHRIEEYPDMYQSVLTTDTSTIVLITRGELHFIASEAAYWSGDKGVAADQMREGIRYHMNRLQVSSEEIDQYLDNADLVPGASNITIRDIMQEKYKALYLQPELWNDMRRYGYSNNDNDLRFDDVIIYPSLSRPHNLYEPYWGGSDDWLQRINYDPETEERYNREELIRLDAFRNPEWLKKPMIWAPQN